MKLMEKNGIEFQIMSMEQAFGGLEILRNGFFPEEAFCLGVGASQDQQGQRELEALAVHCAGDQVSVVAIDQQSCRIAGVCYNKYQTMPALGQKSYFQEFIDKRCRAKTSIALINEMLWFDTAIDVYGQYNADCSLELMFLATHKDFRQRGIAKACVEASLQLAKTLPSAKCTRRPNIATAIFTSPHSIRTGRTLEFDELLHVPAQQRVYEGKCFSDHPLIGPDHPGFIVMAKRI